MQHRTLGNTGLNVSAIGLGTWQFGGEWAQSFTQHDADAILDAARQADINLIDTAECYGDHLSEQLVGNAVAPDRDRWILATKFGHQFNAPFDRTDRYDPASVQQQLEDSLRALRTDRIDIYQFHSGSDASLDQDELWTMLEKQKQAGKIAHLGISLSAKRHHQVERARELGAEVIQVVYNRLAREAEQDVLPICRRDDLGVLARVPLASGFLTGKYTPEDAESFGQSDMRGVWRTAEQVRAQIEQARQIQQQEVPEGVPMAQWALAWCLKDPAVSSVIPGAKSAEQVRANAAAAELLETPRA